MYAGFMAWFTAAPVIYLQRLEIQPNTFGQIAFITTALCMLLGSVSVAKLVNRFGVSAMLCTGLRLSMLFSLLLFVLEFEQWVSVASLVVVVFFYFYGTGFVWPAAFGGAMKPFAKHAGIAGALYGTIQVFRGFVGAQIVAYLSESTLYPIATLMLFAPALSLMVLHSAIDEA